MGESVQEWGAGLMFGEEPTAAPRATARSTDAISSDSATVVPQEIAEPAEPDAVQAGAGDTGAKRAALVMGAAVLIAAVTIVAAMLSFNDEAAAPDSPPLTPSAVAAPSPVASTPPAVTTPDQAIRYTASADCPAGSTSAQSLTETTVDSAWVCVRGPQGARVDGQVLRIDFGRSHVVSAVAVTPGWVAKTPGGQDEWLQHRVVSRLQYVFNDDNRTVFTQDTGNAHGPVTTPLPRTVLASAVTVTILQTSRPPASPLPDPQPGAVPGFADSVLGDGGGPLLGDATATTAPWPSEAESADPVDATFAMSSLKFFGHEPS
ncbi:hypothetical protein PDG61_20915 [Mycolicibacterium sp. BiH015]|uniref:hypothetical protein n=1 Tax=Mycolicibacterium sp. BiH015 TaxID=3018808 RepID=UPI0022E57137|nr:hypothetical protein [Mycolicibacterium sp. BiH015]MDA2893389.1 hypothetical protein [Mycolicibacterium sp. BiH015]